MPNKSKVLSLSFTSLTTQALLNPHPARRLREENERFLRIFPIFDPGRADVRGSLRLGSRIDESEHWTLPLILHQSALVLRGKDKDSINWNPSPQTFHKAKGMDIVPQAMVIARIQKSLRMFEHLWDEKIGHIIFEPREDWREDVLDSSRCWESLSNPRGGFSKPVVRMIGQDMGMDKALILAAYGLENETKISIGHRPCRNRTCVNPWHCYTQQTADSLDEALRTRLEPMVEAAGSQAISTWYELGKPRPPIAIPTLMGFMWRDSWTKWEDFCLALLRTRTTEEPKELKKLSVEPSEPTKPQRTESEARQAIMALHGEDKEIFGQLLKTKLQRGEKMPTNLEMLELIEVARSKPLNLDPVVPSEAAASPLTHAQYDPADKYIPPSHLKPISLGDLMKLTKRDLGEE